MNWTRGLFRVWLVATGVWLVVGSFMLADGFTATRQRVPPGLNEYDCLVNRAVCPAAVEPDWSARAGALVALIASPVAALFLCLLVFWMGVASLRATTWIARGFRQGRAP